LKHGAPISRRHVVTATSLGANDRSDKSMVVAILDPDRLWLNAREAIRRHLRAAFRLSGRRHFCCIFPRVTARTGGSTKMPANLIFV